MTIKEQLTDIMREMDKPQREVKVAKIGAKLATLAADLQDDETEIPADALEPLNNDMRKIALMGFVALSAQSLKE